MIYGLLLVLFATTVNVVLLLLPLWLVGGLTSWLVDLAQRLHWMRRAAEHMIYLALFWLEIVVAACLQMILWGLAPHTEPERWTMAVFAFAIGRATMLLFRYKQATSQAQRRFASWQAALSCITVTGLCFLAFIRSDVHGVLAALPVHLLHLIVGGGA